MSVATIPCPFCGKPALPDYPHRHETPVRPDYDPMPSRPASPDEMIAIIREELIAEIPARLHVAYVPNRTEAIGVGQYSQEAAGLVSYEASLAVVDAGQLGPSFAPAFARRIGAIRLLLGEVTVKTDDLAGWPFTRQLEELRGWCIGNHLTWYEHQARPLCWILLRHWIFGGYRPEYGGALERLPGDVAVRLVLGHPDCDGDHRGNCPKGALDHLWGRISDELNGIDLRRRTPAA